MQTLRTTAPIVLCTLLSITGLALAGCSRDEAAIAARRAARQLVPESQTRPVTDMQIAQDAYSKADFPKALDHFLAAGKTGDADALYYAGAMYSVGDGARKNVPEALKLFEAAAQKNQPDALNALARLYLVGDGVERNPDKAIELFERAIAAYPPGEAKDRVMEQRAALSTVLQEQRNPASAKAR